MAYSKNIVIYKVDINLETLDVNLRWQKQIKSQSLISYFY